MTTILVLPRRLACGTLVFDAKLYAADGARGSGWAASPDGAIRDAAAKGDFKLLGSGCCMIPRGIDVNGLYGGKPLTFTYP